MILTWQKVYQSIEISHTTYESQKEKKVEKKGKGNWENGGLLICLNENYKQNFR